MRLLVLDGVRALAALAAPALAAHLRWEVSWSADPGEVVDGRLARRRFDVVLADLDSPQTAHNGFEALLAAHVRNPATLLTVWTAAASPFARDLLAEAWRTLPLAAVLSKRSGLDEVAEALQQVADGARPAPPPDLAALVPAGLAGAARRADYGLLVQHAGHARLWRALLASPTPPSYRELAELTGLSPNTLASYREALLPALAVLDLRGARGDPTMRELHGIAHRCRPLLLPHLERRLPPAGPA